MAHSSLESYAPTPNIACPSTLLRTFSPSNQTLGAGEVAYVAGRAQGVSQAWRNWLGNASQIGYDLASFDASFPAVGIASSGGGFRAALFAAGALNALDGRNNTAAQLGTGGLLQVSQYLSGLSGGSWLISSMLFNDFPQFRDLVLGNTNSGGNATGWLLDLDIAIPGGIDIFDTKNQAYYGSVLSSVYSKAHSGFETSITDLWSRLLSYHFLNGTTRDNFFTNDSSHGAGLLWSDIPKLAAFQAQSLPFPILVSDSIPPSEGIPANGPPLNSTVYEITPFEMGSFDPSLSAMANLAFVGTPLVDGQPPNSTACVEGFDQAAFIFGTDSSFFNVVVNQAKGVIDGFDAGPGNALSYLLDRLLNQVTTRHQDVANWPNPFRAVNPTSYQDANARSLQLVDGGENAANVPLDPLFVKARRLSVVVALDASAETTNGSSFNFPNGTSIGTAKERITTLLSETHQGFPPIPDDFVTTGVNLRPTFFGCDPVQTPPEWPMLIYIPNAPPVNGADPVTNPNTLSSSFSVLHQNIFLDQAFSVASSGFTPHSTAPDAQFPRCLQCAAIDRARLETSPVTPRSPFCAGCFARYCFDPASPPSVAGVPGRKLGFVDPDLDRAAGSSGVEAFVRRRAVPLGVGLAVAVVILVVAGVSCFVHVRRRRRAATAQLKAGEYAQVPDLSREEYEQRRTESDDEFAMGIPPGGREGGQETRAY